MIHYIMIDDGDHKEVCRYTHDEMTELFNDTQRRLMKEGKVVTCSLSHGNKWLRAGSKVTACDMSVIAARHMDFINNK